MNSNLLLFTTFVFSNCNFGNTNYLLIHLQNHHQNSTLIQGLRGFFPKFRKSDFKKKLVHNNSGNARSFGCKCNCGGECEPKGCSGPKTSSRSISG